MSKKHLIALMLSFTLAASGAVAEVTPGPIDAESRGSASKPDAGDKAIRRALEQFRTTQVPLSRAMAIAERLHNGSRTADIMFEVSGSPAYRVRTVKNERVWENVIDANTGKLTEKEVASSLKELDRDDLANIIALQWIKQELSDAVQIAEKAALGNALAGGLIKQDGKVNFVIVIASGDQLKEVTLEPPKVPKQSPTRR